MTLGQLSSIEEIIPRLGDVLCQDDHVAVLMMTSDRQVRWITIPEQQVSSIQAVLRCMGALVGPIVAPKAAPEKKTRKKTKYNKIVGLELRRLATEHPGMSRPERMRTAMENYAAMKRERKIDAYLKDNGVTWDPGERLFSQTEGKFTILGD